MHILNKEENVIIELYMIRSNNEHNFLSKKIIESSLFTTFKINNKIVIQLSSDHFRNPTLINLSDFLLSSIH